ncbi:MAG: hypothetical protein ACTH0S_06680, partial [Senegalia sp. (in: firmicutes)]
IKDQPPLFFKYGFMGALIINLKFLKMTNSKVKTIDFNDPMLRPKGYVWDQDLESVATVERDNGETYKVLRFVKLDGKEVVADRLCISLLTTATITQPIERESNSDGSKTWYAIEVKPQGKNKPLRSLLSQKYCDAVLEKNGKDKFKSLFAVGREVQTEIYKSQYKDTIVSSSNSSLIPSTYDFGAEAAEDAKAIAEEFKGMLTADKKTADEES